MDDITDEKSGLPPAEDALRQLAILYCEKVLRELKEYLNHYND